jgi:hypothetical protein
MVTIKGASKLPLGSLEIPFKVEVISTLWRPFHSLAPKDNILIAAFYRY